MFSKKVQNQKGVTLIEVLISVALLGIITTVFIQILNSSILLRSKSDIQAEASAIAMSQIESLKKSGVVPKELVQTTTERGYEIVTTLTEVTDSLSLDKNKIQQVDNEIYKNPFANLSIGNQIALTAPVIFNDSLDNSFNKVMQLDITEDTTSTTPIVYSLTYNTAEGAKSISLGAFERLKTGSRLIKIIKQPELEGSMTINVNDSTHEPLTFAIFEDFKQQIVIKPSGSDTALNIVQNLSEKGDSDTLKHHYYEILVTVSKHGQTYARLLSTWTVKGE